MTDFEARIREHFADGGSDPEEVDWLIDGFTCQLAEALKVQGKPKGEWSSTQFGYLMAIQRLDRTGAHDYFS